MAETKPKGAESFSTVTSHENTALSTTMWRAVTFFAALKECNMEIDDKEMESRLLGFEKMGWIKKSKIGRPERKAAEKLGLPEMACKYNWFVAEKSSGEVVAQKSKSEYENKQGFDGMDEEEVHIEDMPIGTPYARALFGLIAADHIKVSKKIRGRETPDLIGPS